MSQQEESSPKVGAGHASAMFRQGLAELRGALYNEPGSIAQPTQYGIYGTKTPGEVAKEREASDVQATLQSPDQEPASTLDRHVEQAQARAATRQSEPKEQVPERE
jgi:hypothetical protein